MHMFSLLSYLEPMSTAFLKPKEEEKNTPTQTTQTTQTPPPSSTYEGMNGMNGTNGTNGTNGCVLRPPPLTRQSGGFLPKNCTAFKSFDDLVSEHDSSFSFLDSAEDRDKVMRSILVIKEIECRLFKVIDSSDSDASSRLQKIKDDYLSSSMDVLTFCARVKSVTSVN